ncbi:7-deoxyloganetin glucosyltransferase [Beta vulgaris subsp. vulgaris]|uniref:7-deoxyloganetin glucosyltransferase n=1 Tax=Beta vulgaris subsp. vulgaris TaxID=3555 RepID=UPI002036C2FC|nr:7-deoxyloganetin glucosyltransferase [Beta vulgaris subsp. vulgaris]
MGSGAKQQKPHAVCVPYPAQGHINPMLQLAKLLHSKGFHITFVNTEYNHNRLVRSRGREAVADRPSFRFETITDGMPPSDDVDSTQDIPSLCISTEKHCLGPFKRLLARLNEAGDVPPVSCVVSDGAMFFTIDAAEELGIPEVLFWTASACGFLGYAQYGKIIELGLAPFKDANFSTNGDLEAVLDWVPGMKNIRLRDIPSFIRTTDPNEPTVAYIQRLVHHSKRAAAIIFNSFDALEDDVLRSISSNFPPTYALGPLHLLLESMEAINEETKSISTSLWKEDPHCLEWLDSYEPNSVVYVNFGSITVMTNDQLIEFAWGLANSNQPFLWIARPDLVIGDSAVLPPDFLEETKNRGLITSWCDQEHVLAHPAIGGFLTHCGWNSTIETLINGVPIVCWPFFAEQQTNCWYSCTKWGIGMEIDANVKRSEVERQVRELMEGEQGKEMKRNAMKWKKLAYEATAVSTGSSYNNLDEVIKILRSIK